MLFAVLESILQQGAFDKEERIVFFESVHEDYVASI